jgi:hypothetical protein
MRHLEIPSCSDGTRAADLERQVLRLAVFRYIGLG